MSYENVVVGTDGSPTAELAVRHAANLALDTSARLVVVTAYEPHGDELVEKESHAPEDIRWALTDRVQAEERGRRGRTIAREVGAKGVVTQAIAGSPADVLLEAAGDFGADLIVVGSVGLTGASRLIHLGSVASAIGHHAPCDVLIVHTTT
ncbi:MAG: universal stress protein [Acidimicrobiales bacterium]